MIQKSILAIICISAFFWGCEKKQNQAPVAKKIQHITTVQGETLRDDYFWLRNAKDPAVLDYLKEENKYTDTVMKPLLKMRDKLYGQICSYIKEDDKTVPFRIGKYTYYYRYLKGQPYSLYCRQKIGQTKEEILMDENSMAKGKNFFTITLYSVSPDGNLLAYLMDTVGNERTSLYIKDLRTNKMLSECIPDVDDIEWANDSHSLLYTTVNSAFRTNKIYYHILGESAKSDKQIMTEADEAYNLDISKSKDKQLFFLGSCSKITSEYYYLSANHPESKPQLIKKRQNGLEYYPEVKGNTLYIMVNDTSKDFRIVVAPLAKPSYSNWKELIPAIPGSPIDTFDLFKKYMVIEQRWDGCKGLYILNLDTHQGYRIAYPKDDICMSLVNNYEANTDTVRIFYESMRIPSRIYDIDMNTKAMTLLKEAAVPNYNMNDYCTKRITVTARDGAKIPVSLVYKKTTKFTDTTPFWLWGYGAYGMSEDPYFSHARIPLLDRGMVFAIAHIRGGKERGAVWYTQGKLLNKKNSFYDFIDCADYLVSNHYTSRGKLAIQGGSAGGLLMGAVLNERPDLCQVALVEVPFVDVLNTMLDASLPSTVPEYDEWGNPNDKQYFNYIKSYSPYNNIKKAAYPHMLVTGGFEDPRVSYWEPVKYVAKLRTMKTDHNQLLLSVNMHEGHLGTSDRYNSVKELAFQYAFVLDKLGIRK